MFTGGMARFDHPKTSMMNYFPSKVSQKGSYIKIRPLLSPEQKTWPPSNGWDSMTMGYAPQFHNQKLHHFSTLQPEVSQHRGWVQMRLGLPDCSCDVLAGTQVPAAKSAAPEPVRLVLRRRRSDFANSDGTRDLVGNRFSWSEEHASLVAPAKHHG